MWLAASGWSVHAVDRDAAALAALAAAAHGLAGRVTTEAMDLEVEGARLPAGPYGAVLVFNYLHRPLMPSIVRAVAPGGVLVYETFTTRQAERGRPRNPAFLLREGELVTLVQPLQVVRWREGEFDGRFVASVVAGRPASAALSAGEGVP